MEPNPSNFPILSYVMTRFPSIASLRSPRSSDYDIEAPSPVVKPKPEPTFHDTLLSRMPHLADPRVVSEMSSTVSEIAQTRSVLSALGPRPDHEAIDIARSKLAAIESRLSSQLEEISLSPGVGSSVDSQRDQLVREKAVYKAIVQLDEMHDSYEKLLRGAEDKLMKIYDSAVAAKDGDAAPDDFADNPVEVNEDVSRVLKEGENSDKIDLSGKKLRIFPEALGKLKRVVSLNLSSNQLQGICDSIAGLENLEELNLSSNSLQTLPDTIGFLLKLKILNVSGNKLTVLPDSICNCRSLVELDASFNNLGYLPTNIGFELKKLRKLLVQYNKIRSLPTSVGDMTSLQHLDVHFNALRGLPLTIGKLTNLLTLNLSGNFSDLKELPETFCDLVSLEELDLSNNQIHALPNSFGSLKRLRKLNVDQNPITIPPIEVLNDSLDTVRIYMDKRLENLLKEEEERSRRESEEVTETGWLKRSVSRLNTVVSTVSDYLGSPKTPEDPCLDQQL